MKADRLACLWSNTGSMIERAISAGYDNPLPTGVWPICVNCAPLNAYVSIIQPSLNSVLPPALRFLLSP